MIEFRFAEHPLIPFHAFSRDVSFVLGCVACGRGEFGTWIWYFSIPDRVSKHQPSIGISRVCARGAGRARCLLCDGPADCTSPTWVDYGHVDDRVYAGEYSHGDRACAPDVLGFDLRVSAGDSMGDGHVISGGDVDVVEFCGAEHQGIAASLVTTVVNYSISLSLGFAGTVEVHVNHGGETPEDVLKSYRGALYFAMGLGGLGILLSVVFTLKCYWEERQSQPVDETASEEGSLSALAEGQ